MQFGALSRSSFLIARHPQDPTRRVATLGKVNYVRGTDLFAEASRHRLLSGCELVQIFEPDLTSLQRKVLDLLGVPQAAYISAAPDS